MSHILILFSALILVACNSYKAKTQPGDENNGNVIPASIDYAFVNAKVFAPKCLRCHSEAGGNKHDINLETYENVIANLEEVAEVSLVKMSMPPKRAGGPLGEYERTILKQWIDEGAPRDGMSGPAPTPTPAPSATPELPPPPGPNLGPTPEVSPTPVLPPVIVQPTWDSISKNIFEAKCVKCHAPGEKAEDYPFQDKDYVTNVDNDILVPGKPEESELYKAITRQDKKMMPPAKTGMTLSDQEKEAIRIWILNGAKD